MSNGPNLQNASSMRQTRTAKRSLNSLKKKLKQDDAQSLVETGEMRLVQGDLSGLHFFDKALKIDGENPDILYRQGLALLEYADAEEDVEILRLAATRLKQAVRCSKDLFAPLHAHAVALFRLGEVTDEFPFYMEAQKKITQALSLSDGEPKDVLADLYADYGHIWKALGVKSGEASDLNIALKAYKTSKSLQSVQSSLFWTNYAEAAAELGDKTNDLRLFIQAIDCYKQAISLSLSDWNGWLDLGAVLTKLYSFTHDDDHFLQANECYQQAANLHPLMPDVWDAWANALYTAAHASGDKKQMHAAIEKCQKSLSYKPDSPLTLATLAKALSYLGKTEDNLAYLLDADNQIARAFELDDYDPELYLAKGICLANHGAYYNDLDLYYQAVETFQEGTSIDRSHAQLWLALGQTYMQAHALDEETKSAELSIKFLEKALTLSGTSSIHYSYAKALFSLYEIELGEEVIVECLNHFDQAIKLQTNASYVHPEWIFDYAVALDKYATLIDSDSHYLKALDLLSNVLVVKPDYQGIHLQIALVATHYGELISDTAYFEKALHHYRIANLHVKDDDEVLLNWGITLISFAEHAEDNVREIFSEAEHKMIQSAKLGNVHAYYHLACLYALLKQTDKALYFLEKSREYDALPELSELLDDDWLDNLQENEAFQTFLNQLKR